MGHNCLRINLFDMTTAVARVVDIMSPAIGAHHLRVAYLACRIGETLGVSAIERNDLIMAAILHDIGAFTLKERLDMLRFEIQDPGRHAEAGYQLLREFKPFAVPARIVRYHHTPWENGKGSSSGVEMIPLASHILQIADRVAVLITEDAPVLTQVETVCEEVTRGRGNIFVPEHVDAILSMARKDVVWLELMSEFLPDILRRRYFHHQVELDTELLLQYSRLICRLIDFKSSFTATHSSGVAATAVAMAEIAGFSAEERRLVEIAAYLHDLGKLAIPTEIIEKKGKLTDAEWFVMRAHVYYTYQTLMPFESLGLVNAWGALHQERLNGSGYPFGYEADVLPLGARLMAVADVFTALTEDRPYRKGMSRSDTSDVLTRMARETELDDRLVRMTGTHYNELNQIRKAAQLKAAADYDAFRGALR